MKINAVSVTSHDMSQSIKFYELLGFEFPQMVEGEDHVEAVTGEVRLMIDSDKLIATIIGEKPKAGNHSNFAIEYENPQDIDRVVATINLAGFKVVKEPWDAFWGQRYAIVEDPAGYKVDLYARL